MKQLYPLLLGVVFSLTANAQSVDLDKFFFTTSYQQLPQYPLDTTYRTYNVRIETGILAREARGDNRDLRGTNRDGYSSNRDGYGNNRDGYGSNRDGYGNNGDSRRREEDPLEQQIVIEGWRRLNSNGHITVLVRMEDAIVEQSETKDRVETIKDKNNKVVGQRSHFFTEVVYSFAAKLMVSDYHGNLILDNQLADRNSKLVYRTAEYDSRADAEAYFKFNLMTVTKEVNRISVANTLNNLSVMLSNYYGYRKYTVNDFMWILDSRRHPEYDAHRNAWILVKQALFSVDAERSVAEARQMMQPAIDYFNKIKKRYNSSSKADRKLRYASYYNLAKIYYYLDDPDAAMQEATGLEMNDFDARDGRQLQQWAMQLKQLLQQSGRTTRHFPLNMDRLEGPAFANTRR